MAAAAASVVAVAEHAALARLVAGLAAAEAAVVPAAAASMVARVARGKIHKRGICSAGSWLPGCWGTSRDTLRRRSRSGIRSSMQLVVAMAVGSLEAAVESVALARSAAIPAAAAAVEAAASMVARVARGKRSTPDICSVGSWLPGC